MAHRLPLLLALLLLSGLLLAVGSAHGAQGEEAPAPLALEEPTEEESEEEGEEEETECEAAEEEVEEGELAQDEAEEICAEEKAEESRKKNKNGDAVPEECVLRSAHAHAATPGKGDKLKLTIGYTTYEPARATIEVGHLATLHRHLGRSGVLRIVEPVGERDPKRLVVNLQLRAVKSAGCPFRRLVLFPR